MNILTTEEYRIFLLIDGQTVILDYKLPSKKTAAYAPSADGFQ